MKNTILLIALTCLMLSTNAQDVLKLKTINTYYGDLSGSSYHVIGELDGAVINMDSLSLLLPQISVVNISDDTFSSDIDYEMIIDFLLYADTGLLLEDHNVSRRQPLHVEFFPNDTLDFGFMGFKLSDIINYLKGEGIELEQISYWKMITGISYTSKDGAYSEKVFYEGADTSTFNIIKTSVSVREMNNNRTDISIFPNPAQSQFTVTNTENATIYLYNLLGQKVKQVTSTEENTVIQTEDLSAGMYVLKVKKGNGVFAKKVQVIR